MGACWTVATQYACRSLTTQSVCLPIFYHSFLHARWCFVSLFAIPACMVSHYQPCLLVWSLTIGHAFWCDASLTAHLQPCLLVCCLTIGHAIWCGASLEAMPSGVMPHYQPYLLVCCLTIGHAFCCWPSLSTMPIGLVPHYVCWSVATATDILLVECR